MELKDTKILIAVPCYSGVIDARCAGSIYFTGKKLDEMGIENALYMVTDESYVPMARNRIAYNFLNSNFTHLLCIDADISFVFFDVLKLIEKKEEFVAGEYRIKSDNVLRYTSKESYGEVIGVGCGFQLLSKSVFELLKLHCDIINRPSSWEALNSEVYDFYRPEVVDGNVLAEDYSFCRRWINAGKQINLVEGYRLNLTHYGKYGYRN